MHESSNVDSGGSPGTPIAVLVVGLMAIGIVFGILGSTLYLTGKPAQRPLTTVPARAVLNADLSSAK